MTMLVQLPLVLSLTVLGLPGDPAPTTSRAVSPTSSPAILVDPCRTTAADASAILGDNVDERVLSSGGTGYNASARTCKRFVADFKVPSNANPDSKYGILDYEMGGFVASEPTQATCANTELWVTTYEKAAGASSFVQRTSAKYKGQWSSGGSLGFSMCNLVKMSGQNPISDKPNSAGEETWRVSVRATVNGSAVAVKARIGFIMVPW